MMMSCKEKTTTTVDAPKKETATDHVAAIMNLWPGAYNNNAQIEAATKKGEAVWTGDADNGGWLNVHAHYVTLDKPDIGENVLYVEEYRDGNPEVPYRQRIYNLEVDSTGVGRVIMNVFKDKKKFLGAFDNLSMLDTLSKKDVGAYPSICDLIITKEGDKYRMKMGDKECAFGDKYFSYEVLLSKDVFAYRDKITQLSNDSLLTTAADFQFHNLDKIGG